MTRSPGANGTRKQFGDLFPGTWTMHCDKILGCEPAPDVGPTPCRAGHDCDCSAQGPGGRRSSRRDFVRVGRCSTPDSRMRRTSAVPIRRQLAAISVRRPTRSHFLAPVVSRAPGRGVAAPAPGPNARRVPSRRRASRPLALRSGPGVLPLSARRCCPASAGAGARALRSLPACGAGARLRRPYGPAAP